MSGKLPLILVVSLAALISSSPALAMGEDILALTGRYTFFIKPDPTSHVTFYQKMVPCVEEKTVGIPRTVVETYGLPIPFPRRERVLVTETPVGHAKASGPCVQCFPSPVCKAEIKDVIVPRVVPVQVPGVILQPKCVPRRLMSPQWFAVEEHPMPPRGPVRKVRGPG